MERQRLLAPDLLIVGVQAHPSDTPTPSDVLVEAVRTKLFDVLERPISSEFLREVVAAVSAGRRDAHARSGRVIAFHSTKGGVGKSTLSINTATGLALDHPDEVLLIDCSLQLGVCASALDLTPKASIATAARERDRLDARLLRELCAAHGRTGYSAPRKQLHVGTNSIRRPFLGSFHATRSPIGSVATSTSRCPTTSAYFLR